MNANDAQLVIAGLLMAFGIWGMADAVMRK